MNLDAAGKWQLACKFYDERNTASAAAVCLSILHDRPGDPMANWMLATVQIEAGRPRRASQYAMAAAGAAAGLRIDDLLRITWALLVVGEGARAAELLLAIDPADPDVQAGLWGAARQLGMLELHAPALRLIEAIADPALRNTNVTTLHGHLLGVVGRDLESEAAFEATIAADPVSPLAHLMLSRMPLRQGRERRIDRLRALLRTPPPDGDQVAMLQYALFAELDALDDTAAAWSALAAGAAARNRLLPYDAAAESRLFDRIIGAVGDGFLPADAVPETARTPIFVVGMPRTGTTLLERILGNHPDVQTCGELTAFVQQHHWVADRVWNDMLDEQAAVEQPRIDAGLLGRRYLDAVAWRTNGRRYFTDKTPGNFMAIALILKALPGARVIHLHRDPMDACFSNLKVLFAPDVYPYSYSLDGLATHHRNYARLMRHWHDVFPGRILDVGYERLVADSEGEARRILAYCGLAPAGDVTDVTANRNAVSTESRSQVREPIHQRNVGSWRRYASRLVPLERALAAS